MTQRTNSKKRIGRTSPVSSIDPVALQSLRATFDTTQLLRAVDDLDTVRALLIDPDELRADLLRLHKIAHTLINGGAISITSVDGTIAELGTNIEAELENMSALLLGIRQRLWPLLALAPDEVLKGDVGHSPPTNE